MAWMIVTRAEITTLDDQIAILSNEMNAYNPAGEDLAAVKRRVEWAEYLAIDWPDFIRRWYQWLMNNPKLYNRIGVEDFNAFNSFRQEYNGHRTAFVDKWGGVTKTKQVKQGDDSGTAAGSKASWPEAVKWAAGAAAVLGAFLIIREVRK